MTWIFAIVFLIATAIIIFLKMPYSIIKIQFNKDISFYTNRIASKTNTRITEQDIKTIWHDSTGDLVYFDVNNIEFAYSE